MKTWVKYCGICREQDFCFAVQLGVDAIGIICVADSPRFVDDLQLRALAMLPRGASKFVLVFQNATAEFIRERIELSMPDMLQFHGDELAGFADSFSLPYIKASRSASSLIEFRNHQNAVAWLIDDPNYISNSETTLRDLPIILAGELSSANVKQRIELLHPFGVDVSRGIESTPREKDFELMTTFMQAVHETDHS